MEKRIHTYVTILGKISLVSDGDVITEVLLPTDNLPFLSEGEYEVMTEAAGQIEEYLSGRRKEFDVPYEQQGTGFQMEVWKQMSRIPYGRTATYAEIAEAIGHPKAFRAVGTACGLNHIAIIVPCHRVLSSSGIGGYRGGLAIKRQLLSLEERSS